MSAIQSLTASGSPLYCFLEVSSLDISATEKRSLQGQTWPSQAQASLRTARPCRGESRAPGLQGEWVTDVLGTSRDWGTAGGGVGCC